MHHVHGTRKMLYQNKGYLRIPTPGWSKFITACTKLRNYASG